MGFDVRLPLVAVLIFVGSACNDGTGLRGRTVRPAPSDRFARCFEATRRNKRPWINPPASRVRKAAQDLAWEQALIRRLNRLSNPASRRPLGFDDHWMITVHKPQMEINVGRLSLGLKWIGATGPRYQRQLRARDALEARYALFRRTVVSLKKRRGFADRVSKADRKLFAWCEATFIKEIRAANGVLGKAGAQAIREHEAFVKQHPADEARAPDRLLLLTELYLEKAELEFRRAERMYQRQVRAAQRKARRARRAVPFPRRPTRDFSPSIAYCRRILRQFPGYRGREKVIYLLGFLLRRAARSADNVEDEKVRTRASEYHARARQALLGLVCANRYDPLAAPRAVAAPAGYHLSLTRKAVARNAKDPFTGFDPYQGCRPKTISGISGRASKKRRRLLAQSWFLVGEEHLDADPSVSIEPAERLLINKQYQGFRGSAADRKEIFRNRWNEMQIEKKLRALKLHNYYAISAYTRVAQKFPDSKEYNSALYKRAWTYFKIDKYLKALAEFDDLLVRAKEKDLQENAVRYVALCAFYQKQSLDPFAWLLKYYKNKGWLNDKGQQKYTHVKAAFYQLAEVLWEESQPPPDDPGAENYSGEMLVKALTIHKWILKKGGFKSDRDDVGNPDFDWKYFKGKAPVQVRILQILGILQVNVDKRLRAKYPRRALYEERKRAFDRFGVARACVHAAYAKEYESRWGRRPRVTAALAILRTADYLKTGKALFDAGLRHLEQYVKARMRAERLHRESDRWISPGRWREYFRARQRVTRHWSAFPGKINLAGFFFRFVVEQPQFKGRIQAYEARFYWGLVAYYSNQYQRAARLFGTVERSTISTTLAKRARQWRLRSVKEALKP